MKKKISIILLIMFLIIINLTTISYGNNIEVRLPEKTEAYKKWESLSPEEKEKTIQPRPYAISIKQSLKRSKYNALLGGNTSLNSRFNLTQNYNLIVKDQKKTMSCWAFSTTTMLESNVMMKNNLLNKEYSPLHIEYRATEMYDKIKLGYGNSRMAIAYMTSGYGPVNESDFPMENVYSETQNSESTFYLSDPNRVNIDLDKEVQLRILDTTQFANIYKKYDSTTGKAIYYNGEGQQYTLEQVEALRKTIKQHITEYGAVTAEMYFDTECEITSDGQYISQYHNQNTDVYAYKIDYPNAQSVNHQIVIVGWDDAKEAYIVQNSSGKKFENNGCFYISYDDVWIESEIYGVNNAEEIAGNNVYDKLYQYDELGMNVWIGYDIPMYYANVFARENKPSGKDEYVTEVGLYIGETTGIDVYVNSKDGEFVDSQGNSKLKRVSTGKILEPGYHVIKLNATEDTKLIGDKFIVAVKSTNDLGGSVPLEMNMFDSGSTIYSDPHNNATGKTGQSFFGTSLTKLQELNGYRLSYVETIKNSNVCIKAFTKYVEQPNEVPVTGVTLNKTSITLTEGETDALVATVLPENSTNPSVTWTSSNNNIATVSGDGVITAVSAGEVTITVITEDGGYTSKCNVKVETKEIRVTDIVLSDDDGKISIIEGETSKLTATVLPFDATNKNVTWNSSNTLIATVSNEGVITAVAPGTADITVTTIDGNKTATCKVTVTPKVISATSVLMTPREGTIKVGNTLKLTATVVPSDASNKILIWESTDTAIATVNSGLVTAHKPGNVTIKAISEDGGHTGTCEITVLPNTISVEKVTLNETVKTIKIGESLVLRETIEPSNATNKKVTWQSSNTEIANVTESGIVTGLKQGVVTITVTTDDGNKKATCQVTVESDVAPVISVTGVSLNESSKTIKIGETLTLIQTVTPQNATNKNIIWASSNENVATVVGGKVTAISEGETTITVITVDGNKKATCAVKVEKNVINAERVELDKENLTLKINTTQLLTATVFPENATDKEVTWTTLNAEIAKVSETGYVTGVKAGIATITVTTKDGGFTDTCKVTVTEENIRVNKVSLNEENKKIKKGETFTLVETIEPSNATNKNVTWTSSNEDVATVLGGVVTAFKPGTTTITVKTADGNKTATCIITVENDVINVTGVKLDKENEELQVGEIIILKQTVLPENATNKNVAWETSNAEIATVENGKVTALKEGTVVITVKTVDGNKIAKCTIVVKEKTEDKEVKVESLELDQKEIALQVSDKTTLIVKFNPELPSNTRVKWETSNENVAVVDENGIVKAIGVGEATITVTSDDGGFTSQCKVTVTKQVEDPDDIYKDPSDEVPPVEEPKPDNSIADKDLPQTGLKITYFAITLVLIVMAYSFIRYRRLRDVK